MNNGFNRPPEKRAVPDLEQTAIRLAAVHAVMLAPLIAKNKAALDDLDTALLIWASCFGSVFSTVMGKAGKDVPRDRPAWLTELCSKILDVAYYLKSVSIKDQEAWELVIVRMGDLHDSGVLRRLSV